MRWLRRLLRAAFPEAGAEVDLHGLRVPEALAEVERALAEAKARGAARVRVVCGKGRGSPAGIGVLRTAVAGWLDAHGYGGRYRRQVDRDGKDGAIWVDLEAGPPTGRGEAPRGAARSLSDLGDRREGSGGAKTTFSRDRGA
ncbi:MAG: hypothetical protein Kow0092_17380 [Deferrisomatales bacterium]